VSRELELKFIKIHWYKKDNSRNQKTITVGRDTGLQVDANQNQMETETLKNTHSGCHVVAARLTSRYIDRTTNTITVKALLRRYTQLMWYVRSIHTLLLYMYRTCNDNLQGLHEIRNLNQPEPYTAKLIFTLT